MGKGTSANKRQRKVNRGRHKMKWRHGAMDKSWMGTFAGKSIARGFKILGITADPNQAGIKESRLWERRKLKALMDNKQNELSKKKSKDEKKKQRKYGYDHTIPEQVAITKQDEREPIRFGDALPDCPLTKEMEFALNRNHVEPKWKSRQCDREYCQRLINAHGRNLHAMCMDMELNFLQWSKPKIRQKLAFMKKELDTKRYKKSPEPL